MEFTLPTEAQWEYVCRAGTTGPYAGEKLDDLGWYEGNGSGKTKNVGLKLANPWGFYDMHGNVWEWCWDWYGDYEPGFVTDPIGSQSGSSRVLRGGGWNNRARYCRSAGRGKLFPYDRYNPAGFRLCLSSVNNK